MKLPNRFRVRCSYFIQLLRMKDITFQICKFKQKLDCHVCLVLLFIIKTKGYGISNFFKGDKQKFVNPLRKNKVYFIMTDIKVDIDEMTFVDIA